MEEENNRAEEMKIYGIKKSLIFFLIVSIIVTMMIAIFNKRAPHDVAKYVTYTIIIDFLMIYFISITKHNIFVNKNSWWVFNLCYILSATLLVSDIKLVHNYFWMIGLFYLAKEFNIKLSILLMLELLVSSSLVYERPLETVVTQIIIGLFVCSFVPYLYRIGNFVYISLVLISMSLTISFISHDFHLDRVVTMNTFYNIGELCLILFLFFLLHLLKKDNCTSMSKDVRIELAASMEDMNHKEHLYAKLQEITKEDYPLILQLSIEAPEKYLHSSYVAGISMVAAKEIGADVELAFAGGWYHEIGILKGKEYVKNGELLGVENFFPKELIDIIRQHNGKTELPKSIEAAIVLLADTIISIIEHLEKTGKTNITYDKIVEHVFSARLNQGTLDDSGITIQNFNQLKQIYINECKHVLS